MKMDHEVEEIIREWAENVREDIKALKDRLSFCKADYEMYLRLVKDLRAAHSSQQYARWLESNKEYAQKYTKYLHNVESALEMYPEYSVLFKGIF